MIGSFSISITLWVLFALPYYSLGSIECLEDALKASQSCSNPNKLYATLMGQSSGFGSEFIAYLMPSLFTSLYENRRLVYFVSKRPWEYDCSEKKSWACYFTFQLCNDSVALPANIDISRMRNVHEPLVNPGSDFLLHETMVNYGEDKQAEILKRSEQILKANNQANEACSTNFKSSVFAGLLARHLYNLTPSTKQAIMTINQRYDHLTHNKYVALQLRLTDKKYETPESDWAKVSDMRYISDRLLTITDKYQQQQDNKETIKHVYIATDNCTAAVEVMQLVLLKVSEMRFHGTCFHSDGKRAIEDKVKKNWNPREDHDNKAMAVLADIEMLRGGVAFMGSFFSNFVRMVHYLRYPRLIDSHHFVVEEPRTKDMLNLDFSF